MRKINLKLFTFLFLIVIITLGCQEEKLELTDTYTDTNFFPKSIIALENGGCIVATGYENVIRLNDNPTNDSNKVVWSTKVPSLRIESIVTDNNDFIVVGESQVVETDTLKDQRKVIAEYLKCVKLSENGDILWEIRDTMMTNINIEGVIALENGEFGVFGYVNSLSTDTLNYHHPFVLKINSQGEVIWRKIFDKKGHSDDMKAIKTSEGGITIMVSSVKNNNSIGQYEVDKYDLFVNLTKIDKAGNVVWMKAHNVRKICGEKIADFQYLSGLELSVISSTEEECTVILEEYRNLLAMKFDKNGEVFWSKNLNWGKFVAIEDLEQINDNLFVATTTIGGLGNNDYNYFNLVGLNKEMEVLWNYKSKGDRLNYGHAISKGFNDDIYVTIGNSHGDLLLSTSLRGDDFSEQIKQHYSDRRSYMSNLVINHFKIK